MNTAPPLPAPVERPTAPSPPPYGAARLLRIFALEAGYECLRTLRTPAFALPSLAFPVVFYIVFALLIPGGWKGIDRATWLLATYGVFGVMGPALFGFGVGLAIERQNGWLELKRVSPMPTAAYFVAKIVMSLLFGLVILLLLSTAGVAFGGVSLPFGRWLAWVVVLLLGTLPFSALGLWVGTLVKGQAAVAVVNLVYLPMSVLSGLWIPLAVFPSLMQEIAVLWPAWHLAQLSLGTIGQLDGVDYGMHVAVLAGMAAVPLWLAIGRLRRG